MQLVYTRANVRTWLEDGTNLISQEVRLVSLNAFISFPCVFLNLCTHTHVYEVGVWDTCVYGSKDFFFERESREEGTPRSRSWVLLARPQQMLQQLEPGAAAWGGS